MDTKPTFIPLVLSFQGTLDALENDSEDSLKQNDLTGAVYYMDCERERFMLYSPQARPRLTENQAQTIETLRGAAYRSLAEMLLPAEINRRVMWRPHRDGWQTRMRDPRDMQDWGELNAFLSRLGLREIKNGCGSQRSLSAQKLSWNQEFSFGAARERVTDQKLPYRVIFDRGA